MVLTALAYSSDLSAIGRKEDNDLWTLLMINCNTGDIFRCIVVYLADDNVTTGTAEFAAPEVVKGEPVGYYTDMWSVGVLTYVLLSGLSPFGGTNDEETLKNVKNCDWNMDNPIFNQISDSAKDFIQKLLISEPSKRMTVHETLAHPWLTNDQIGGDVIPSSRYHSVRDAIRQKYDAWPEPFPPLGRISNFSSLRKHRPAEYHMHDSFFERSEAQPRFIIKPYSTSVTEGQSATFYCRVIASSPPIVTWHHDVHELKQSVKYMKKYNGNDYALTINRVKMEDKGEYTVRARNSYGSREEIVFLSVTKKSEDFHSDFSEPLRKTPTVNKVGEFKENEIMPNFTFHLRPRLIQKNHQCKLICTLQGNPTPKVEWFKDGMPINEDRMQTTYRSGVCTLEIFNTRLDDAGLYSCTATNSLGEATTECTVTVQTKSGELTPRATSHRQRRAYDSINIDNVERSRSSSYADVRSQSLSLRNSHKVALDTRTTADDHQVEKSIESPIFITKLTDMSVNEGESLELSCDVNAASEAFIEWFHNGERVTDTRFVISYAGGKATLRISKCNTNDSGEYVCQASNSAGQVACRAAIIVHTAVTDQSHRIMNGEKEKEFRVIRHLDGQIVNAGSTVTFEACVSGNPERVTWTRNQTNLVSGDRTEIVQSGERYLLSISNVSLSDAGQYQLQVGLNDSQLISIASLIVTGNPLEPPVSKLPSSVNVVCGSPANLTLELINSEGYTVQWFKGNEKIEKSERIKSVKSGNTFKLNLKMTELTDEGVYVAKVIKDKKAVAKYVAAILVEP
ncbi:immunoglobulin I-set domain protein [Dictyocaulus viviparus]|uniref:Immunoglobulin I-set domain protein n=1 Tax=Dictyocaulus viviparus TaxID=29172 RepID=A0A0D8XIR4_DICVI|nr:immunoglobulin I-set domain protein [Dictyocaulus viviparus]